MAIKMYGEPVATQIKDQVREQVKELHEQHNIIPTLHTILVGDDYGSQKYNKRKIETCKSLGINSENHQLPKKIEQQYLEDLILELNEDENAHGILVQLPLPEHIKKQEIMKIINPLKDVDGLTPTNVAELSCKGEAYLEPCTPKGILKLLGYYEISVKDKNVVIMGRSDIVGRPLFNMMSSKKINATVTLCHSGTQNIKDHTTNADILIAAIGKPEYVTRDMVKDGAVVIDVGINRVEDPSAKKGYIVVGDVDFQDVFPKASYITPVPGGVGLVTIAELMENTFKVCRLQNPQIKDII